MFGDAAAKGRQLPRALHLAPQGARRRRRAQPPRAPGRHCPRRRLARRRLSDTGRRRFGPATRPARSAPASSATPRTSLSRRPSRSILLLTSNARDALRSVDTIIIDEIHALVPTKRGAHLAVSIERLTERAATASPAHRPVRDPTAPRRGRAIPRRRQRVDDPQVSHEGTRDPCAQPSRRSQRDHGGAGDERQRRNRRRVLGAIGTGALPAGDDRRCRAPASG